MNWFGVRTYYRSHPRGRPRNRDDVYRSGVACIEERVILVRAASPRMALRKGVAEARRYAKAVRVTNRYGQTVVTEFLELAEAYYVDESPADGVEVFSSIEVVSASESRSAIRRRKSGPPPDGPVMRQFIAGWISDRLDEEVGPTWYRPSRSRR